MSRTMKLLVCSFRLHSVRFWCTHSTYMYSSFDFIVSLPSRDALFYSYLIVIACHAPNYANIHTIYWRLEVMWAKKVKRIIREPLKVGLLSLSLHFAQFYYYFVRNANASIFLFRQHILLFSSFSHSSSMKLERREQVSPSSLTLEFLVRRTHLFHSLL